MPMLCIQCTILFGCIGILSFLDLIDGLLGPSFNSMCLDHLDPTQSHLREWVPCPWNEPDNSANMLLKTDSNESAPFDIDFHCFHANPETCVKAQRAFEEAGRIITDTILFRQPIRVNATLLSFCKATGECGKSLMTLGGSSTTRSIPLLSDDGMLRMHPQALVKQFGLNRHPTFAPYDIQSLFNADAPFWFQDDGRDIAHNEADFLFVILHEFMHGLGFYSSWNEYFPVKALTPDPTPFLARQLLLIMDESGNVQVHQFLESAMDRWMVRLNNPKGDNEEEFQGQFTSTYTSELNTLRVDTVRELLLSPQFATALDMHQYATTPDSLGLFLGDDGLILETSLQPFQAGSSISHVDYARYTNTTDFLMRFMQDRGVTLAEAIRRAGGDGPIGPKLLRLLEKMGYATIHNPQNKPPLHDRHNNTNAQQLDQIISFRHRRESSSLGIITTMNFKLIVLLCLLNFAVIQSHKIF